ncbi:hypothetical protein BCR44DRAFT_69123 [Catenaria anguillulae PL171]|uniref:Secretory pathway protein Sec39-domain-containing protein n=1 Tax=Catenaria anguillulae PL171 TaxID=765915 RepID=A0A1Y2HZ82_9FUNG|nr:hypothetical protein BCR44DRAFT_69123 [Catenaria anguillulae PL171]
MATPSQLPDTPAPPLLYDLFPAQEWHPDQSAPSSAAASAAALPTPPPPADRPLTGPGVPSWHLALSPDTNLVAVLTDTHLEIHAFVDAIDLRESPLNPSLAAGRPVPSTAQTRVALWPLPSPDSDIGEQATRDHRIWRRIVWGQPLFDETGETRKDSDWLAVADWDGSVHVLELASQPAQLLHVATINPHNAPTIQAKQSASATTSAIDPLVFLSLSLDSLDPTVHKLLSVSFAGAVRLAALTTLNGDPRTLSTCKTAANLAAETKHVRYRPLGTFSTAPWLHFATSATYVHISRTLYVTGKADCPPHIAAAVFKDHQSDDTTTELLLDAETEPVPVIALTVASGGIQLHQSIEPPVPKRAKPETGLLVSLASVAKSLFGLGGGGGPSRPAESDPVAASLEMELTGVQLSAWTSTKSTMSPDSALVLLLLRDAGGNLLVLSPDLTTRERYDGGFLTLAHQGHPLSHASWWDGAIATATSPGQAPQRVPAIITCSEGGLLFVHSYPQFTPLSAAEQFAAPVALAQAVNGRCCILDCETTSPTGTIAPAAQTSRSTKSATTSPRGLIARSLRSITNTLLWHFDDDPNTHAAQLRAVMAQDHAVHAATTRRHVTMYDWRPLTPNEMLMRHLVDHEYTAALELAKAHGLATDVVYQAQWRAVVAGEGGSAGAEGKPDDKIVQVLANVKDVMWVLQACVDACPRDAKTAREVIVHGLRLTEEAKAWATRVSAASAAGSSSDDDDDAGNDADDHDQDQEANTPDDHTFALLEYRLTLLRLLDRLELYTRIHGMAASSTPLGSDPNYQFLRDANLVDVACAYARLGDTRALSVLLSTHPALAVFRPTIAKCFPAYLDPAGYSKLVLPDKTNCSRAAAREPAKHWRQPDWCESEAVMARVGWVDDVASAAVALGVEPVDSDEDMGQLTQWYIERARDMEADSGCVDMAVRLLDLARVRNVPGLGGLHARLKQLQVFAYDVLPHVAELALEWQRIGLDEFERMPPEQVLKKVFSVKYDEVENKGPAATAAANAGKAGAAATVTGLVGKAVGGSVGGLLKRGGSEESPSHSGLHVADAMSKLSLDQMVQRFLVPYVVQSGAHLALLDILSGLFLARPELVIRILAYDDLWWNRVHPDPAVGELQHDPKQEVVFAERVLEMAYSVETADAKWLDVLGRLFEVIPDLSGDDDDEDDDEQENGTVGSGSDEEGSSGDDDDNDDDDVEQGQVSPASRSGIIKGGKDQLMDPHRVIVWRRVQVYEALITAAEVLSHVHLYVSPIVLRNASKHPSPSNSTSPITHVPTGPASSGDLLSSTLMRIGAAATGASTGNSPSRQTWTRDQYSILHELVRRTPMVPIELDWLLDAINDLVVLKFWRIPLQDVYGPVAQHALLAGSGKHFGMAAKFIPPEQVADVVMQLVNQRADTQRFDDALKILNIASIPSLASNLTLFAALQRLHDLGVPGVSRTMSKDDLIAHTVECPGISRDAVLELGASLGFSIIKTMTMIIKLMPQDKAIELSLDLLSNLATQADSGDERLACETVLGIARQYSEHSRIPSLLQVAFETVPTKYVKQVLDLCSQIEPMVVSPIGSPQDIKGRNQTLDRKLVPPVITKLYPAESSYADIVKWLTHDEHVHDPHAPAELAFNSAASVHSALVAAPFCNPVLVDASFHDLLVFAGTKRAAVKSLTGHELPVVDKLATLSTTSTAVEEFGLLSTTTCADQNLISAATELQAIERQSIDRVLADFPDIDLVQFTSTPEYQSLTLARLLKYSPLASYESAANTAALLVEHAQLQHELLVHAWLTANSEYAGSESLLGHRPAAWDRWVASVKNGGDHGEAVLLTIKSLLAQPATTRQAQVVLYETTAQLVPDSARSSHARQALIDLLARLHAADWSVQALVTHCLRGNRGFFSALFQSFVASEQLYETLLRDLVPKLGAITPILQIDELPAANLSIKPLVARDLESILTAAWLTRSASLPTSPRPVAANPFLTSSTPSPVPSPAKHDDGRLGRLFATIASTATTFRPGSPSMTSSLASTEKTILDSASTLLSKVLPAEWPAVSRPVMSLVRQQFSIQSLPLIDKLASVIHEIAPNDPVVAAIKDAVKAVEEWTESRLLYPFMDRLLVDANIGSAVIQQLILDGHPIARIRDIALRAVSCHFAFALSLDSNQVAPAKYDNAAFDLDLRNTFKALVVAQADLTPVLRSVHGSNKEADLLLQVVVEHGGAGAAHAVDALIAQLSPSTPVLAFKMRAIRSIGGTVKDLLRDLDSLHEQWLQLCSTDQEHGARLRALVEWMEAGTVDLTALWVCEYQFGQSLAIDYIVHVRLQTPSLASEIELEVIQNMSSQVHILAFALTSTSPDVLAYGKSLLPPPSFDAAGNPVQQSWPSPILDALVPVLQLRKSLADVAQRFGIAQLQPSSPAAATNLLGDVGAQGHDSGGSPVLVLPDVTGMHPVLWAAALVGRVPLPDFKSMLGSTSSAVHTQQPVRGGQARANRPDAIQLDDVDDEQRRAWVKIKYDQELV